MLQVQMLAALHKISPIWIMLTQSIQVHMESVVCVAVVLKAINGVVGWILLFWTWTSVELTPRHHKLHK